MGFKIVLTILILTSSDVRKEWQLFKSIKDDFTIERYRLFVKTKNMFLHRFHAEEDKFFRLRKIIKWYKFKGIVDERKRSQKIKQVLFPIQSSYRAAPVNLFILQQRDAFSKFCHVYNACVFQKTERKALISFYSKCYTCYD